MAAAHEAQTIAAYVWARMSRAYGNRWNSQFGKPAPAGKMHPTMEEWATSLAAARTALHQVELACKRSLSDYPEWPPTLPQFLGLCDGGPLDYDFPAASAAWAMAQLPAANLPTDGVCEVLRATGQLATAKYADKAKQQTAFPVIYTTVFRRWLRGKRLDDPVPDVMPNEVQEIESNMTDHERVMAWNEIRAKLGMPLRPLPGATQPGKTAARGGPPTKIGPTE